MLSPPINLRSLRKWFSVKSREDFRMARSSAHLTSSLGLPVLGGTMHCVCVCVCACVGVGACVCVCE